MKKAILILLVFILISSLVSATNCGVITSSVTLNSNIQINGTCFTVNASGITLDGNGHKLSGNGSGMGVLVYGDNVTVKNLVIDNFLWGVSLVEADGATIENNKISSNVMSGFGLHMWTSKNNKFLDNSVTTLGSAAWGIASLYYSTNNYFENNDVVTSGYTAWGVYNSLSAGNKFDSNKIITNGEWSYGMFLSTSPNVTLLNNDVTTTGFRGYGMRISASSYSSASKNRINTFGDFGRGFFIQVSQNVTLFKNKIKTQGNESPEISLDPYSSIN